MGRFSLAFGVFGLVFLRVQYLTDPKQKKSTLLCLYLLSEKRDESRNANLRRKNVIIVLFYETIIL